MPWRIADRWLCPPPDPRRVGWLRGRTFAHRGLHGEGRIENSPAAFAAAIEAGFGIECDVRKSRDGRAVVFHDADLARLTGQAGEVAECDVATLTATRLRGSTDCIPTLRDLLALAAGAVPLLLELKTDPQRPVAALCLAVRREIEGYQGQLAVMSFDPRVSAWFRQVAAHVVRGLVVSEADARTMQGRLQRQRMLWRARPDFLAYDVRDLPSAFAAAQRARGLPVLAWTVGSPLLRAVAAAQADAPIAEGAGIA